MSVEQLMYEHGCTGRCGCPDPAADLYEPCENCGTRIAHLPGHRGLPVEDDVSRGCAIDGGSHCHNWTTHTPDRCRDLRRAVVL